MKKSSKNRRQKSTNPKKKLTITTRTNVFLTTWKDITPFIIREMQVKLRKHFPPYRLAKWKNLKMLLFDKAMGNSHIMKIKTKCNLIKNTWQ